MICAWWVLLLIKGKATRSVVDEANVHLESPRDQLTLSRAVISASQGLSLDLTYLWQPKPSVRENE